MIFLLDRWWYTPILPADENFPNACRQMLTQTLSNIHSHLSQKRPTDIFLLFLISTSNTFIVFFRELAQTSQTSIGTYVEEHPSSALAQLVDRDMQKRKLRMAADDIVQSFVPPEAVNCDPVRSFLTEIIAGVVLEKVVEKFSSAEWINATIVYLLEKETQPEILQKIDIGEATAAVNDKSVAAAAEQHKQKRISRAEEEMERAMKEAQELNVMIAEEEAKRNSGEWSGRNGNGYPNGIETSTRTSSDNGVSIPPSIAEEPTTPSTPSNTFTSFDQLLPLASPAPTSASASSPVPAVQDPLYRASITLSDLTPPDAAPKGFDPFSGAAFSSSADRPLRSKPTSAVYLLQIEPGISSVPGWILTRKYADFESLHEVLQPISFISGVDTFTRMHAELPAWRGGTKESLRARLERYINDALKERPLAECEGMKRFLEKDGETGTGPGKTGAFGGLGKGWPNPQAFAKMGGGVLDALTKAPQGAAEGGKALFGGGFMKRALSMKDNIGGGSGLSSQDSSRRSSVGVGSQPSLSQIGVKEGYERIEERSIYPARRSSLMGMTRPIRENKEGYIQLEISSSDGDGTGFVSLPPPPSDMPDDYDHDSDLTSEAALTRSRAVSSGSVRFALIPTAPAPVPATTPVPASPPLPPTSITSPPLHAAEDAVPPPPPKRKTSSEPLSEAESQFVVEIFFAIITELYTLSSAWIFRRSLLNVAKSILLRPGNATLETIRTLIQETIIDGNTVDSAIAGHIQKLRKNGFPSKEERAAWPLVEDMEDSEKEALREKARRLIGERGMPEALKGLMGAQASKECWGVVFDALQERGVARGVVAGLVGEAVRGVCH